MSEADKEVWIAKGSNTACTLDMLSADTNFAAFDRYVHHSEYEALQKRFDEVAQLSHQYRNEAERLQRILDSHNQPPSDM